MTINNHSLVSDEFIARMKSQLLKEECDLEEALRPIAQNDEESPGHFKARFEEIGSDMESQATEVEAYEQNFSVEESLDGKLENIKKALVKINDGTYGICARCHNPIPEERLRANPAAITCITCAKVVL